MRNRPPELHRKRAREMRAGCHTAGRRAVAGAEGSAYRRLQITPPDAAQGYILDLVCFEARLIVEADGWQHAESADDAVRDRVFRDDGFRILRCWNEEVTGNLDGVCLAIRSELLNAGE